MLCLGLDEAKEAEGIDRADMKLAENQLDLVRKLTKINERIVVVYSGGGPVEMPFSADVSAIINAGLAGQGGAEALTNILTGRTNPSGKLAQTWPHKYGDAPTAKYFPGPEATAEHREGLFLGYRFYDTLATPVLFAFGHGLSYAAFEYLNPEITQKAVSFIIKNVGDVPGEEIAQVYVRPPKTNIFRPAHELKGFAKVFLKPGEQQKITIHFDNHAFGYYNPKQEKWCVESGRYEIEIGASSRDIRLTKTLQIEGETAKIYDKAALAPYFSGDIANVSDAAFATLLGHRAPLHRWQTTTKLMVNDTISQLRFRYGPTRFLYDLLRFAHWILLKLNRPLAANNLYFVINMPFSKIPAYTNGKFSAHLVKKLFRLS